MKALKAIGAIACFAGIGLSCGADAFHFKVAGLAAIVVGFAIFVVGRFGDG